MYFSFKTGRNMHAIRIIPNDIISTMLHLWNTGFWTYVAVIRSSGVCVAKGSWVVLFSVFPFKKIMHLCIQIKVWSYSAWNKHLGYDNLQKDRVNLRNFSETRSSETSESSHWRPKPSRRQKWEKHKLGVYGLHVGPQTSGWARESD